MPGLKDNLKITGNVFHRSSCAVIAIFILVLGLFNMIQNYNKPTDECTWVDTETYVKIISVKKGGTAERAGIKPGDFLLVMHTEYHPSSSTAQLLLEQQAVGSKISYMVLRDNKSYHTFNVEIVRQGLPSMYLIMCVMGLIFWITGLWIVWMRPEDLKARILFYLFMSFMLFWTLNLLPSISGILLWTVLILRTVSFTTIPVLFLYFFLLYPEKHHILKKNPFSHLLLFTPTILIMFWILSVAVFKNSLPISWPLGIGLWGLYCGLGMLRLYGVYIRSQDAHLRQQIRILMWGMTFGLIPPFVIILSRLVGTQSRVGQYMIPLMVLIPVSFAYSVVKHRLMDIEIIAKKSFLYTILTGIIAGFYFIVVQFVGKFLQDLGGFTGSVVLIISTLFVTLLFTPLREKIQRLVDRAFYREAYDYRKTLKQFSRALNTLMESGVLMETVIKKICDTMKIEKAYFFINKVEDGLCTLQKSYPDESQCLTVSIKDDCLLCKTMARERRPVFLTELANSDKETKRLSKFCTGILALPFLYKQSLTGFLLLGNKQSHMFYSTEDLELLSTVADQVAVALENSQLHQELTEQERLKHELNIARQIQLNSLPRAQPEIPGFEIYGTSIPAREVGGDYFDYFPISDELLGIVLGDVSGKGTSAALYMSKIQGFFRALISSVNTPKELLGRVNRLTFENIEDSSFVTLIMAVLKFKERLLTLARAGHTPVFYFDITKKSCTNWAPPGIGLALDKGPLFESVLKEEKKYLNPGDALLMYSDGFTEALNEAEEEFGEDRLEKIFCRNIHKPAKAIADTIIGDVNKFAEGQTQMDDMTLIVIKVNR